MITVLNGPTASQLHVDNKRLVDGGDGGTVVDFSSGLYVNKVTASPQVMYGTEWGYRSYQCRLCAFAGAEWKSIAYWGTAI